MLEAVICSGLRTVPCNLFKYMGLCLGCLRGEAGRGGGTVHVEVRPHRDAQPGRTHMEADEEELPFAFAGLWVCDMVTFLK